MDLNNSLEIRLLSSLSKVFADEEPRESSREKGSMLCNEVYAFQTAYCWSSFLKKNVGIEVNSGLDCIDVRQVGLVPSEMPCYADHDENVVRTTPGLYPDVLQPLSSEGIILLPGQWRSVWITVNAGKAMLEPGNYPIEITFSDDTGAELGKAVYQLEIIGAELPKQKLIHTEWFHTDCIATYYNFEILGEEHWERVGQFIDTAVQHGINMILTPLFTPPLDTAVGGERPTVQLVDVVKNGDSYSFGFDKLKRWVDMCRARDVEYFEFSHLFTQWGVKHAPKIIATENGELKRIFGWDTDAAGEDYKNFLSQFLPELVKFIKENKLENCSYFHVSDEPSAEHLDYYRNASEILNKYLKDFPVIDALSDYTFYETGAVKHPIPATNHIEPFLEHNVPDLWTYYCCGQYKKVSNRFFSMPSARNRILGMQLYKFNIKGFLQWGFNFWYSQYSKRPIDPFKVTDAGLAFASGDSFMVYPGAEGPLESLKLEVFYEGLQDMRALELLEQKIGRAAVISLLDEGLEQPITFSEYPKDAEWLLDKREQINKLIAG